MHRRDFVRDLIAAGVLVRPGAAGPFPKSGGDLGTAEVQSAESPANTVGTWTVVYTAGPNGIKLGGAIKVEFPVSWFSMPDDSMKAVQTEHPDRNHYVTAHVSREDVTVSLAIDNLLLEGRRHRLARDFVVKLTRGALRGGDTITVTLGDTANRRNLGTNSPTTAEADVVRVGVDADGSGVFSEIAEPPALTITPAPAVEAVVLAPMVVQPGAPFEVKVVMLDQYYNLASDSTAVFRLTSTDSKAVLPPLISMGAHDEGIKRASVTINSPGFQQLRLEVVSLGRALYTGSAVLKCSASDPPLHLYWGDLHSHSAFSWDAEGNHNFEYARDVAGLDFYASTEHNNNPLDSSGGVTPDNWKRIQELVKEFYAPGRFVTLLAFEATLGFNYGHHNVFYRDIDEPIFPDSEYDTLPKIWKALEDRKAFTIPHHMGIRFLPKSDIETVHLAINPIYRWEDLNFDSPEFQAERKVLRGGTDINWKFRNDKIDRALEIFSMHGQSELYDPNWELSYEYQRDPNGGGDSQGVSVPGPHYARDGWALGHRNAVIASSDNHSAKPGQRFNGLAAVWAPALNRENIWDAVYNKNIYGTTGERIWLEFSVDGHAMGQEFTASAKPTIRATVAGTDEIAHLEIVKFSFIKNEYAIAYKVSPGSFVAEVTHQDDQFTGDSMYYLRARQATPVRDREVWVWSSPIWVKDATQSNLG